MLTSSVFFSYRKTVFLGKCSKYFLTEKQRISFSTHSKNIKRISNVCLCKICCENPFCILVGKHPWLLSPFPLSELESSRETRYSATDSYQENIIINPGKQDILQQIPTRKISLLILVNKIFCNRFLPGKYHY